MLKKNILIVDDEQTIRETVRGILEDENFAAKSAADGDSALESIADEPPDLVLLDIWMPGMDGLQALKKIKQDWPLLPVIMMSGHGNIETAVKATKLGAYDFIEKPLSYEQLILTIQNALKYKELQEENVLLRQKTDPARELAGQSPAMLKLKEQIALVGPTDAWILIQG